MGIVRKIVRAKTEAISATKKFRTILIQLGTQENSTPEEFKAVLEANNSKLVRNCKDRYWGVYIPGEGRSIRTLDL